MKNYLIIGGSTGIGEAIVEKLHAEIDATIFATYFNHSKESGDQLHFFHHNVLEDRLDVAMLPAEIHGFVYCPGAIVLKPFQRLTENEILADYRLQVVGAINTIQAVLPNLNASKGASIVLFSTVAVQHGFNFHAQVALSKGAIEGLTRSLASEFAPTIRVNCIAPSLSDTPLAARLLSTQEKRDANAAWHPLKRIGTPSDSAELAVFLLSDKATWMTGQIIHVDGGMSSIKM